MKIYQLVPTLNFGDAIGNDVIAIKHVIEDMGIVTEIYAMSVSDKIKEPDVYLIDRMPKLSEDDIVIYHMGSGAEMNEMAASLNCRKIMIYHNITPPEFFNMDNPTASEDCRKGLDDMRRTMKGRFTSYIADSEFNKSNMIDMGYKSASIDVIPVIVPFEDYKRTPDPAMVKRFSDGVTNIVFVGRIAPNKKHEDIIQSYAYYKKHVNRNSRLILVGSHNPGGIYYNDIREYIEAIGAEDVIFPGHISFEEILAIYKTADVFLCMSEHEGFCVPLLEAMTFDVPVIAYDACAVPETLGGSGIVVDSKDPAFIAKVINELVTNTEMRELIINAQRDRLKRYDYETIKKELQEYLRDFMNKFPPLSPDDPTKTARKLYDVVDSAMKDSGKELDFTPEALIARTELSPESTDVTALLNKNLSDRAAIETAYIALTGKLPEPQEMTRWEQTAGEMERPEFLRRLFSALTASDDCRKAGTIVSFDPFADSRLKGKGGAAAT